jgi:SAM-dependent methyltransferase
MSLGLRRRAELSASEIAGLEKAMTAFYKNTPASYYQIADGSAERYNPKDLPFHCDLVGRVFPGATVLELGCGTAHLCPYVQARGGTYTGLDHSEALLADNQRRFPKARFFPVGTPLAETFDLVASLYTVEHVADPPAYLESLWRFCRPGGMIVIIGPEFIHGPGLPPGIFFGRTPRRFREKLLALDLWDAWLHLLDLKIRGPRWKKSAQAAPPGTFWMNLAPSVLHGAEYYIDADAIHIACLKDLVWFFEQHGARTLQTSMNLPGVAPELLDYTSYLVIQKPE